MKSAADAKDSARHDRPLVGVSSCVLGEAVRFDAGHKLDRFVRDSLGAHVDYAPHCPEVAIGLGIPRAPIRLVAGSDETRVISVKDPGIDVTDELSNYADQVHGAGLRLSGYVLKRGSPSCGMERVKVYTPEGVPVSNAPGKYAERLMTLEPHLPCEEEGRLNDAGLRESFVERIFTMHRWHQLCSEPVTPRSLIDFHTRHKFLVLAHAEVEYRALGRLVADAGLGNLAQRAEDYIALLMRGLAKRSTPKRHANVLQHLLGFLSRALDAADRATLRDMVDEYRLGKIPLVVPIRFLRYQFERFPNDFVSLQYYLHPCPDDLGIRNAL